MTTFRVWAPRAERVEVVAGETRLPMHDGGGGWFDAEADVTDYAFSLDGGPPRPDPRSPWQPDGVDGPSRVVDHEAFQWTDHSWKGVHLPSAVAYELHVGTFTPEGTFDAVIGRLDHLVDLGVDVVGLMPVAEFSGDRGWGYDGVDLYAPNAIDGGPEGLKRLVDACHGRGLSVIFDVVYNHIGPGSEAVSAFAPYFTDRHDTFWGDALDYAQRGVREWAIQNAELWVRDYRIDGLRLDAVHAIYDDSPTHVLRELRDRVKAI
ncbi:MAG: maltooligosyltrehalose trehalohydrolase, partial [Actinomycetota bacterium]